MQNKRTQVIHTISLMGVRGVQGIAFVSLALATVLIGVNVFTRYVVMDWMRIIVQQFPMLQDIYTVFAIKMIAISGLADEVPGFLLVWIAFCGAFLVHINDEHIAFDGVINSLPKYKKSIYVVGRLCMLILFTVLLYQSVRMIFVGGDTLLETIDIPVGYFMVILPCFALLMMGVTVWHIIRFFREK